MIPADESIRWRWRRVFVRHTAHSAITTGD